MTIASPFATEAAIPQAKWANLTRILPPLVTERLLVYADNDGAELVWHLPIWITLLDQTHPSIRDLLAESVTVR